MLASPRALLAAEEILARWTTEVGGTPLDRLVQSDLRARRYLNSSERRWVADAVFGSVRYWRRQTWILNRSGLESGARERIELWAHRSGAGDNEDLSAADGLPGPDTPGEFLRETLSFPEDMAAALETTLGAEALPAARALNAQAPTTLRVNTLRTTRRAVLVQLSDARPTQFSPWGIELAGRVNIHDLPGFHDGWFEIQEEASQLVALLTDARPGQTVVEIGAGAGGKSLAIAAMMQNRGALISVDTAPNRLNRIERRAERGGVKIIKRLDLMADYEGRWQLSGAEQRNVDKLRARADCVLVDAPCSGSGVLRRTPDAKWRQAQVADFARLQTLLLEQSAAFVSPGGCLLYATCAFEQAQDEEVVDRFLRSGAGSAFELDPAFARLERAVARARPPREAMEAPPPQLETLTSGPYLRTWPHRHNLDAFFAACLVHKKRSAGE
jgi:16S rRNA (cytosine967-C5)-methyltransferase